MSNSSQNLKEASQSLVRELSQFKLLTLQLRKLRVNHPMFRALCSCSVSQVESEGIAVLDLFKNTSSDENKNSYLTLLVM